MKEFRWNAWNVNHIAEHHVTPQEAEEVVAGAKRPFPRPQGDEKWLVRGQTNHGRYLQVIYLIEEDESVYVIHSRPLSDREKRNLRRSRS